MLFDVFLFAHRTRLRTATAPAVTREPLVDDVKGHCHAFTLIGSPNADL